MQTPTQGVVQINTSCTARQTYARTHSSSAVQGCPHSTVPSPLPVLDAPVLASPPVDVLPDVLSAPLDVEPSPPLDDEVPVSSAVVSALEVDVEGAASVVVGVPVVTLGSVVPVDVDDEPLVVAAVDSLGVTGPQAVSARERKAEGVKRCSNTR